MKLYRRDLFFKNGKPKVSKMMCRDRSYLAEIRKINGDADPNWVCAGNRCPFYSVGCPKQ